MLYEKTVGVVVPCFKEETQIATVLETMPEYVDRIYVVDDASPVPDRTRKIVEEYSHHDKRVVLLVHEENAGVGAAIETGYKAAFEERIDVTAVMAGDGQMDPDELRSIVMPVATGQADYSKANRLSRPSDWRVVPRTRLVGNLILSLLTRFATGYWTINDAQTGYTASANWLLGEFLDRGVYPRYGVPNDLLLTCALSGARVVDVPQRPVYHVGEQSKLRPGKVAVPIARLLLKGFLYRVFFHNLFIEGSPSPFAYFFGVIGSIGGTTWTVSVIFRSLFGSVEAVEVVASLILLMIGILLFAFAVVLDILLSGERARSRSASSAKADL